MTTADIERAARLRLGKPFIMGARGPDAYDCSGFVATVLQECGVPLQLPKEYSRFHDHGRLIAKELFKALQKVQETTPKQGDILIQTPENGDLAGFHMAIATSRNTAIHAYSAPMIHKVTETHINDQFKAKIMRIYRLKEFI